MCTFRSFQAHYSLLSISAYILKFSRIKKYSEIPINRQRWKMPASLEALPDRARRGGGPVPRDSAAGSRALGSCRWHRPAPPHPESGPQDRAPGRRRPAPKGRSLPTAVPAPAPPALAPPPRSHAPRERPSPHMRTERCPLLPQGQPAPWPRGCAQHSFIRSMPLRSTLGFGTSLPKSRARLPLVGIHAEVHTCTRIPYVTICTSP